MKRLKKIFKELWRLVVNWSNEFEDVDYLYKEDEWQSIYIDSNFNHGQGRGK